MIGRFGVVVQGLEAMRSMSVCVWVAWCDDGVAGIAKLDYLCCDAPVCIRLSELCIIVIVIVHVWFRLLRFLPFLLLKEKRSIFQGSSIHERTADVEELEHEGCILNTGF